ncbi:pilus assembly protein PilP [Beggiatoa leptomitoformis]|uniref:Pilus assembly protein PilP n=1 Tax=Beggiatoa leptomitoformis TaxID=288004 RepID=A0A2N9YGY5_9GAMM|nr:pilus assembly protein PilP [Beggiatoa leptomitoformis]ALG67954.1 pilus assembly protein PilP [Beggiatoa leptomitoformis]AUI69770.1 pilus assembly protein PilP [Beggiatoa leptomitoformis]
MRLLTYTVSCLFFTLLLTACSDRGMADLEAEIGRIKARDNPQVEPIPEFKLVPSHFYEVDNKRSPFERWDDSAQGSEDGNNTGPVVIDCPKPDPFRVRVGLESSPLDALKLVGILEDATGTTWGLIMSPEGLITRVQTGDYMGQNSGLITSITDREIELLELHPDPALPGCWKEQQTKLAMPEEQ